jgi:hypothetical protein
MDKRDIDGAERLLAEADYSGQPVTCLVEWDRRGSAAVLLGRLQGLNRNHKRHLLCGLSDTCATTSSTCSEGGVRALIDIYLGEPFRLRIGRDTSDHRQDLGEDAG